MDISEVNPVKFPGDRFESKGRFIDKKEKTSSGPDYVFDLVPPQGVSEEAFRDIISVIGFMTAQDEIYEIWFAAESGDTSSKNKYDSKAHMQDSKRLERATREMFQRYVHYVKNNDMDCALYIDRHCSWIKCRCGDRKQIAEKEDAEQKEIPHECKYMQKRGFGDRAVVYTNNKNKETLCDVLRSDFKLQNPFIANSIKEVQNMFHKSKFNDYRIGLLVTDVTYVEDILGKPHDRESLIGRNYTPYRMVVLPSMSVEERTRKKATYVLPYEDLNEFKKEVVNSLNSFLLK